MIDLEIRTAIFTLHSRGLSKRQIAKALQISRNTVKRVLDSGLKEVPKVERPDPLAEHIDKVRVLHIECCGNLVRVEEELQARHEIVVPYSTLTAFCRRHGIGVETPTRAGHYTFDFGQEMQHDTSPHSVKIDGRRRKLQCASLVLCASRMIFAMLFVRWRRFEVRVFLSKALERFGGACRTCMIDNSSVIIAQGSGKNAVPAADMIAFEERFGFEFEAHELGDVNRSARVERPFDYIENNFYPGRTFTSLQDANEQFGQWCDKVNGKRRRTLNAKPIELFIAERAALKPLPVYIPDVDARHVRRVDVDGYVCLHVNRYSVPEKLIGRQIEVREYHQNVLAFDSYDLVAKHDIIEPGLGLRRTLKEHEHPGSRRRRRQQVLPEAMLLQTAHPTLAAMVDALSKKHSGRAVRLIRHLHRMFIDYPTQPLVDAVETALQYGLLDLKRVERIVLRNIAGDIFRLPNPEEEDLDE